MEVISTIKAMEIEPQIELVEEEIRFAKSKVDVEPLVPIQVEIIEL